MQENIEDKWIPLSLYLELREAVFVGDLHRCETILGVALSKIGIFENFVEVTTTSGKKMRIFSEKTI